MQKTAYKTHTYVKYYDEEKSKYFSVVFTRIDVKYNNYI